MTVFQLLLSVNKQENFTMQRAALTGIIGSGKSTVGYIIFNYYSIPFVSADKLSREVIAPFQPGYYKLLKLLGNSYLNADGLWNREKIAKVVFQNSGLLSKMEDIIHPLVLSLIQEKIQKYKKQGNDAIFFEIPLLFEKNLQNLVDTSILVAIEPKKQKEHLQKKADFTLSSIVNRMKFQIPQEEKLKKADYVIWNKGSLKDLKDQVADLMQKMDFPVKKETYAGRN